MSIKDTYKHLKDLLAHITGDLEKSENGNKAASQRVRTGTVKLEKLAKVYRKESISHEKKTKGTKKTSKPASSAKKGGHAAKSHAKPAAKSAAKPAAKAKHAPAAAHKAKGHAVKAKPKAKAVHAKTSVRSHHLSVKRATAKLPTKRVGFR